MSTYSDETLEVKNPIIALMKASVQLRATTLEILSSVLGIKLVDYGNIQRYIFHSPLVVYSGDSTSIIDLKPNHGRTSNTFGIFASVPTATSYSACNTASVKRCYRPDSS